MNRVSHNTRSLVAKERCRNVKRGRMDDDTVINAAATKLRKSLNSTSTSLAIVSTPAMTIANGIDTRGASAKQPGLTSSLYPNPTKSLRVKPAIRAKQTQLFGEKNLPNSQGISFSAKKIAPQLSMKITRVETQQTLTSRLLRGSRGITSKVSNPSQFTSNAAQENSQPVAYNSDIHESEVMEDFSLADDTSSENVFVADQDPIDIPASGTLLPDNSSLSNKAVGIDLLKKNNSVLLQSYSTKTKVVSRNVKQCGTSSLSNITTAASAISVAGSTSFTAIKASDNGDHPCLDETPSMCSQKHVANMKIDLDKMEDVDDVCNDENISSVVILKSDRVLIESASWKSSLRCDIASYGHDWLLHHKSREELFQPWQMILAGKIEKLRLGVIAMYWQSAKITKCATATIYAAINNFGRLLSAWSAADLAHPTPAKWAMTAVIAYRLAFKMEERPEILWEVSNYWDLFPMFVDWKVDRSDLKMNQMESQALQTLKQLMDTPMPNMFLSLYLSAGGWPEDISRDYYDLASYLLALATFTTSSDNLLKNVPPSKLAAAALVLAIKIVNGDRGLPSGMLPHLQRCERSKKNDGSCSCRYEFFPRRLEVYSNYTLSELLPPIRGLSCLLRAKPEETQVLKHSFPVWGENDWQ